MVSLIFVLYTAYGYRRNPLSGTELRDRIASVLRLTAKNYISPRHFFDNYQYFFYDEPFSNLSFSKSQLEMHAACTSLLPHLPEINRMLRSYIHPGKWTEEVLHETITVIAESLRHAQEDIRGDSEPTDSRLLYNSLQSYLRLAVARGGSGPPMDVTMALLGRDVSLQRLDELAEVWAAEHRETEESQQR